MKFFLTAIGYALLSGAVLLFPAVRLMEWHPDWISLIGGTVVSLIFVGAGFFTYSRALKFRQKKFNNWFIISIFARLLIIALVIILVITMMPVDRILFLVSLFVSFFVFQIIEVVSLNKILRDTKS